MYKAGHVQTIHSPLIDRMPLMFLIHHIKTVSQDCFTQAMLYSVWKACAIGYLASSAKGFLASSAKGGLASLCYSVSGTLVLMGVWQA